MALREFLKVDYRGLEQILKEWAELPRVARAGQGSRPLDDPEGGRAADRKKGADALLAGTVRRPAGPPDPREAPGGDRRDRVRDPARQPLLRLAEPAGQPHAVAEAAAVLETRSHLFLSARVTRGPSQDSPQFRPAARPRPARADRHAAGRRAFDAEHTTRTPGSGWGSAPR